MKSTNDEYKDTSLDLSRVFHYVVEVPKGDSAFLYFQMEANEGLCFYSTLEHIEGDTHRKISIIGDRSLKKEVDHLLQQLQLKIDLQFIYSSEN